MTGPAFGQEQACPCCRHLTFVITGKDRAEIEARALVSCFPGLVGDIGQLCDQIHDVGLAEEGEERRPDRGGRRRITRKRATGNHDPDAERGSSWFLGRATHVGGMRHAVVLELQQVAADELVRAPPPVGDRWSWHQLIIGRLRRGAGSAVCSRQYGSCPSVPIFELGIGEACRIISNYPDGDDEEVAVLFLPGAHGRISHLHRVRQAREGPMVTVGPLGTFQVLAQVFKLEVSEVQSRVAGRRDVFGRDGAVVQPRGQASRFPR